MRTGPGDVFAQGLDGTWMVQPGKVRGGRVACCRVLGNREASAIAVGADSEGAAGGVCDYLLRFLEERSARMHNRPRRWRPRTADI